MTGVIKAVIYMLDPVCGMIHTKNTLLLIRKSWPCSSGSRVSLTIGVVLYRMSDAI